MDKATVVGSGPNGLAAAVTLARAGLNVTVLEAADEVGGGTRSGEVTLPGLIHDQCSGIHPLAVDNAFSRSVDLAGHGLSWTWPEVQYSHPLEAGAGAAVYRDVNHTAGALGKDAAVWRSVFGPLARSFADVTEDFLRPMIHVPDHPVKLARFGAVAGMPVSVTARLLRTPEGRALFGGVAAHAFRPFHTLASSAVGAALGTAAHTFGWPAAVGGSAAISDAMVGVLESHGGRVETGVRLRSLSDVPDSGSSCWTPPPEPPSTSPGTSCPRQCLGRCPVSGTVRAPSPCISPSKVVFRGRICRPARLEQSMSAAASRRRRWRSGRSTGAPCRRNRSCWVTQQSVADPTRARGGVHPVDTYAHVPAGFTGDATAAIIARIEEYAPGFRDRIVATTVWNVRHIEDANPNYIEGDIVTGANSRANCCSARGSPSTRTAQGRAVSTCVPQPPRRVPEPTACAVTTRHCPR